MAVIDMKNTLFYLRDGGAKELALTVGEGTLTYVERINREYLLERGVINTVRDGDQVPMEVSFAFRWTFLMAIPAAGTPAIEEAIKGTGEAVTAGWVTSSSDACEPYAVDIAAVHNPPCAGEVNEQIVLPDFRWEELSHDFKAGTVACSGKCNALNATIQRGELYT